MRHRLTPPSLYTHQVVRLAPGVYTRGRLDFAGPWPSNRAIQASLRRSRPSGPRNTPMPTRRRTTSYAVQRGRQISADTLALAMEGLFTHHNPRSINRMVLINAGFTPRQARQLVRMARREEFVDVTW